MISCYDDPTLNEAGNIIMAYITNVEVKAVRTALKAAFGKEYKFSVTGGNTSSLHINLMAGPHSMPQTAGDLNHYHFEEHLEQQGRADLTALFTKIKNIGMAGHWDESDTMTDYFHCAYYFGMGYGSFKKDYINSSL